MNDPRSKLIVALDVADRTAALRAVDQLSGHVGLFKIGLELFTREGPRLVEEIRNRGEQVFLDLKLHDIPNTVRGAVRSACHLGVQMLTIHASGGPSMLAIASQEAQSFSNPPLLLAVTALTSLGPDDVHALGIGGTVVDWVERLAVLAYDSGIRGLVASSKELPMLRQTFQGEMKLVIPGIRPSGSAQHDQSRTATPGEAIQTGADFIVVGRPILQAPDPASAADAIVAEIKQALLPAG
jgi:orotidine-5'-phosphate decarboxylase